MIYPRLKVARDLLADDGVIFISIDESECENMRKVCDEIFGERNLVAQIPWQSRASIQNDTDFSINHEYIIVYAKIRRQENRRLKESNSSVWYRRDSFVCRPLPLDKSRFDNPDNDPRGLWKADPFDAPNIRPNLTYPITNPNTGELTVVSSPVPCLTIVSFGVQTVKGALNLRCSMKKRRLLVLLIILGSRQKE